ncbi:MAG: hypothetical protein KDD85_02925 [Parvularculaceae bacterium]|nr:hypothetical protein [Parvularculaceae bacterium]
METRVDKIAERIYRVSTFVPEIAAPAGFTFNQFLIDADEPLLFHTGMAPLFPRIRDAVKKIIDPNSLRWIGFSHMEGDECGALNEWLALAPGATAVHGTIGCDIWLNDLSIRPPRALGDNETLDLGGARVRWLATPHLPHNVDAGLLYEETTATLFCSDLFTHAGAAPALTEDDIFDAAIETDKMFPFTPVTPQTGPGLRRLAALEPETLAIMHGSAFHGDGAAMLNRLADYYDERLKAVV